MALLQDLIQQISDPALRERILQETDKLVKQKKFGLVFEEHLPECTPLYDMPISVGKKVALKTGYMRDIYTVLKIDETGVLCESRSTQKQITFQKDEIVAVAEFGEPIYPTLKLLDTVENAPESDLWHTLIEADNYHALQLLEYLYAGKVDCIYIDPPYNTGAKDWKYNNDYVDSSDAYRHSKWLSFMEKRLRLSKKLLNPENSVLIVTIDEKEYLHLGCLLEEVFPEASIQMITSVISAKGVVRTGQFSRVEEYIYILQFGGATVKQQLVNMLDDDIKKEADREIEWLGFRRRAPQAKRLSRPNQFYPVYVNNCDGTIYGIGDVVNAGIDRHSIIVPDGCTALWPLSKDGDERLWSLVPEQARINLKKGYLRVKNWNKQNKTGTVYYLASGTIDDIENGVATILGRNEDGSIIAKYLSEGITPPKKVWNLKTHNAETYGTDILNDMIGKRFDYPKSLYAVHDVLKFFVDDKPDALIIDFFSGSGTTLHAVNLINSEDNGHRRCIMVTNNEVSVDEADELTAKDIKPGDEEWERWGIAHYVTWPRTICSINGHDINGNPLQGEYISTNTVETEKPRIYKHISIVNDISALNVAKKKELLSLCCKGALPQSLVKHDSKFILSDNAKHFASILFDDTAASEWIEALEGMEHITEFYIVTNTKRRFTEIKEMVSEVLGNIKSQEQVGVPMSAGFKTNAAFFKLSFLDKTSVSLGRQFKELLPVLWMKGGAVGKCPVLETEGLPSMMVLPENKMAILIDEIYYPEFDIEIAKYPEIKTVFIVTDSEGAYREMMRTYDGKECYQLYRDYLDNFRINIGR